MAKIVPGIMKFSGTLGDFTFVNRAGCLYIRRKRGTVKKAVLNEKFQRSVDRHNVVNRTALPVNDIVKQYVGSFKDWPFYTQMLKRLKKCEDDNPGTHLRSLAKLEVNQEHKLESMLTVAPYTITTYKDHVTITLKLNSHPNFSKKSNNNCFFYEVIVILWDKKGNVSTHDSISTEWVYYEDELPEYDLDFKRTAADKYYLLALNLTGGENADTKKMMRDKAMMILGGGVIDK